MSRRGMGIPQVESDFMSLLMGAGFSIQQARLVLSNPMVAPELVALIKREAKGNAMAKVAVRKRETYTPDALGRLFTGGVAAPFASLETWRDESIVAAKQKASLRAFVAKRYKKTQITSEEIIEAFRAVGFRPATLYEACAYLENHLEAVRSGAVRCQRDIVPLGTVGTVNGELCVPYLTDRSAPAENRWDYRLETMPLQNLWGLGEWFLFVQEVSEFAYGQEWNF